jgi:hypothetical protein
MAMLAIAVSLVCLLPAIQTMFGHLVEKMESAVQKEEGN